MQVVANAGTLAMTGFDDSLNIYLGAVDLKTLNTRLKIQTLIP